jgi:uncharacterized membrane protein YphA (DoxX/SURF4 family)
VIVVASVVLGGVFVLAGILKVSAPRQWRSQSGGLGVPGSVAAVVPFAELIVGALLVGQVARRQVALVAAAMLLGFTALLVRRLTQGRRPPCACFGALTTKPIGWGNVARNVVLLALAALVALSAS